MGGGEERSYRENQRTGGLIGNYIAEKEMERERETGEKENRPLVLPVSL